MAVVMLPTNEENEIIAKSRTKIEYTRSLKLYGRTSIDAGVNWVNDQCKLVRYKYVLSLSCRPCPEIQFGVTPELPIEYQPHAKDLDFILRQTVPLQLQTRTKLQLKGWS